MVDPKHFNPVLNNENLLRKIGQLADKVEKDTKINVVRCNVGNPNGETPVESNKFMEDYYRDRPLSSGYDDHRGDPEHRRVVANALTVINRLQPGELDAEKICCVDGGTGGLNVAVSLLDKPTVLVSEPFYPPWEIIIKRNGGDMKTFELRKEDSYLLNKDIIRQKLLEIPEGKPAMLMYHYPYNPTGKTLSEDEAKQVAGVLNDLVEEFPNLVLLQEDLYLATIRSDIGVYTPLPYLNDQAKENTLWIHSPSKEGHGKDRGAIMATTSKALAERVSKSAATFGLGMATVSLVGTTRTLTNLAGGIDPIGSPGMDPDSVRYKTADYYQKRMQITGKAFLDLEKALDVSILDRYKEGDTGIPEGTYYLLPKLEFMKGKSVPEALRAAVGHDTIETTDDIKLMLAHAHLVGMRPMTVAQGEIFFKDNKEFRIRLAPVDTSERNLADAANTLKGVIGLVMEKELKDKGINSIEELGVQVRTVEELQKDCPTERVGLPPHLVQLGHSRVSNQPHAGGIA